VIALALTVLAALASAATARWLSGALKASRDAEHPPV
jgi:hypothetical protein